MKNFKNRSMQSLILHSNNALSNQSFSVALSILYIGLESSEKLFMINLLIMMIHNHNYFFFSNI